MLCPYQAIIVNSVVEDLSLKPSIGGRSWCDFSNVISLKVCDVRWYLLLHTLKSYIINWIHIYGRQCLARKNGTNHLSTNSHREEGSDGDWKSGCISYVQEKEHPIIMQVLCGERCSRSPQAFDGFYNNKEEELWLQPYVIMNAIYAPSMRVYILWWTFLIYIVKGDTVDYWYCTSMCKNNIYSTPWLRSMGPCIGRASFSCTTSS